MERPQKGTPSRASERGRRSWEVPADLRTLSEAGEQLPETNKVVVIVGLRLMLFPPQVLDLLVEGSY